MVLIMHTHATPTFARLVGQSTQISVYLYSLPWEARKRYAEKLNIGGITIDIIHFMYNIYTLCALVHTCVYVYACMVVTKRVFM